MVKVDAEIERLRLAYLKQLRFISLGIVLISVGVVNFVISYMYFPYTLFKGLSSSTILVLTGIVMLIIINNSIRNISYKMKQS